MTNVRKNGTVFSDNHKEIYTYKGIKYLCVYHFVPEGTKNRFSKLNRSYNNNKLMYSRLNLIEKLKYQDKYVFMVIQDGYKFIWSQTNIPNNTSDAPQGYTLIENGYSSGSNILAFPASGAGIRYYGDSTYLSFRNENAPTNWFGSIGTVGIWSDNVPAFGNSTNASYTRQGGCLVENYIDLYMAVEDANMNIERNDFTIEEIVEY